MPWWLTNLFPALLICFLVGLLLGLAIWWFERRSEAAEYERRRLEAEAESDRLRLRVSSLKASEERAKSLEGELAEARARADHVPKLEEQLTGLRSRVDEIPELNRRIIELTRRSDAADRLEAEVITLRGRAEVVDGLQAEVVDLRADAARADELAARLATLESDADRAETLDAEIRTIRLELEESRSRVSELEVDLSTANGELGTLRAEAARVGDLETTINGLSGRADTAERLEADLEAARTEAALVPGLQERIDGLTAELDVARTEAAAADGLRGELERSRADADQLLDELETTRVEAGRVGTLTTDLATARAEADLAAGLRAELASVQAEAERAASLTAELDASRADADQLAADLEASRAHGVDLAARLATAEKATARANKELEELADLRRQLRRTITRAELVDQRDATIERLEAELEELGSRLRAAETLQVSGKAAKKPKKDKPKKDKAKKAKKGTDADAAAPSEAPWDSDSWRSGTTKLGTPGASHVDDLKAISGIGPVMERTLASFGIQTWEQIAAFSDADIATVNEAIGAFPGRIERDDWVGGARALIAARGGQAEPAAETRQVVTDWQSGRTELGTAGAAHTDDLKVINGIGPVLEKTLNDKGIQTWEQLAALTPAEIETVDAALQFPGRIERDEWVAQAKDLIERFPLTDPYHRPTRKTFLNASSDSDPWS